MVLIKQTAVCIKIPCIIYSFVYSVQLAGEAYVVAQTRWELCREVQVGVSSTKSNMVLNTQNKNMKSKSDLWTVWNTRDQGFRSSSGAALPGSFPAAEQSSGTDAPPLRIHLKTKSKWVSLPASVLRAWFLTSRIRWPSVRREKWSTVLRRKPSWKPLLCLPPSCLHSLLSV